MPRKYRKQITLFPVTAPAQGERFISASFSHLDCSFDDTVRDDCERRILLLRGVVDCFVLRTHKDKSVVFLSKPVSEIFLLIFGSVP